MSSDIHNSGVADAAKETLANAQDLGRRAFDQSYDTTNRYASQGADYIQGVSGQLMEWVKDEPWLALGLAFALGYIAGQIFRRSS